MLAASAASSEFDLAIPFRLGGRGEAAATSDVYDELAFAVFAWGVLSSSLSTGSCIDKDVRQPWSWCDRWFVEMGDK